MFSLPRGPGKTDHAEGSRARPRPRGDAVARTTSRPTEMGRRNGGDPRCRGWKEDPVRPPAGWWEWPATTTLPSAGSIARVKIVKHVDASISTVTVSGSLPHGSWSLFRDGDRGDPRSSSTISKPQMSPAWRMTSDPGGRLPRAEEPCVSEITPTEPRLTRDATGPDLSGPGLRPARPNDLGIEARRTTSRGGTSWASPGERDCGRSSTQSSWKPPCSRTS
jgi:hypothetical protein